MEGISVGSVALPAAPGIAVAVPLRGRVRAALRSAASPARLCGLQALQASNESLFSAGCSQHNQKTKKEAEIFFSCHNLMRKAQNPHIQRSVDVFSNSLFL